MQKRRLGTILILLGALLLAGALGLLGYNQWDNGRAQKAAAQVLDQLETTLDEQENHLQLLVPTQVDDTAREMTVTAIDGWDYIGYLSIPSIGLALPVMSEWSYPGLKIAPGRYAGSVFTATTMPGISAPSSGWRQVPRCSSWIWMTGSGTTPSPKWRPCSPPRSKRWWARRTAMTGI